MLDADLLDWTNEISVSDETTQPEIVRMTNTPITGSLVPGATSAADRPTTYPYPPRPEEETGSGPVIHPLSYPVEPDDDAA